MQRDEAIRRCTDSAMAAHCARAARPDARAPLDWSAAALATEAEIDYMFGRSGTGTAITELLVGAERLLETNGEDPAGTAAAFVEYRGAAAAASEAM